MSAYERRLNIEKQINCLGSIKQELTAYQRRVRIEEEAKKEQNFVKKIEKGK